MKVAFSALAVACVCVASAQLNTSLSGKIGIFYPTSRECRDIFGDKIYPIGIGPGSVQRPEANKLSPDISVLSASKNGNKFFLGSVTYGYEVHYGEKNSSQVPYARLAAGGAYYDYSFNRTSGTHYSSKTFGGTAYGEVGVVFNNKTTLSARYSYYQKKDDLDFSGLSLSVGIQF